MSKTARSTRRRTTASPVKALTPIVPGSVTIPDMPDIRKWHPLTVEQWNSIHLSPMFPEFDHSDIAGLVMYMILCDNFWKADMTGADHTVLGREIRQFGARYGLSPSDRGKLSWSISEGEKAEDETRQRRNRKAVRSTDGDESKVDPREALAG